MKKIIAYAEIYRKYNLTLGNYFLEAKISKDEITLRPLCGHKKFIFEKSSPETIEALGQLFIQVAKISRGI